MIRQKKPFIDRFGIEWRWSEHQDYSQPPGDGKIIRLSLSVTIPGVRDTYSVTRVVSKTELVSCNFDVCELMGIEMEEMILARSGLLSKFWKTHDSARS